MSAGAPFLEVRGLAKRFGAHQALAGLDLSVGADELVVVLGPTGAGKTTLLRLLAGLDAPDAGTIAMDGRGVTGSAPAERDVALVFQNFSLYPGWSVRRNLEFPLRAPGRNMPESAIAERIAWAARLLRIEALLDKPAQRLSGGQMQRVAIGRAIVRRPRLFLMDEPLTNLDAKLREALRLELVLLRRELRAPMVYVTHDQAEALSMADRVVVIEQGRVLQAGSPEEVYRGPATPAVARQLGQPAINLFPARRAAGRWICGGVALLPAEGEGEDATIGVRPEDLALAGGPDEAVVRVVEDLGPMRLAVIDWAGQRCRAVVGTERTVTVGERVAPSIRPGAALVWLRA